MGFVVLLALTVAAQEQNINNQIPESSQERFVKLSAEMRIRESLWLRSNTNSVAPSVGSRTQEWTVSFVSIVGLHSWLLEGNFTSNSRDRWFFDGTNIIRSTQIVKLPPSDPQITNTDFAGVPLEVLSSNLTVNVYSTQGGYPKGDVEENIAWLALCSGPYLRSPDRIIPLPVTTLPHAPDGFAYSDKTKVFADELGLPRNVQLLTSQTRYASSVASFWKDRPPKNKDLLTSRLKDGLLKFHYTVNESTNFMGWNFPTSFSFSEDIPNDSGPRIRAYNGDGTVTVIGYATRPGGVFDSNLRQTVLDRRFARAARGVDGIMYHWTNEFVPPTNDARLQAELAKTISMAQKVLSHHRTRARIMLVIFSLFLLLPVVVLYKSKQKPN